MCNVGIIGSSYSVGSHFERTKDGKNRTDRKVAAPFEHWLKKYNPDIKFYNSACSGKGTELYLNKIVYLKEKYDIDGLIIEFVNNRSMLNVKALGEDKPDMYKQIWNDTDLNDMETKVYDNSVSIWPYMRNLYQEMDWKKICDTKKEFNIWNKVQWNIASVEAAMEFWGMLDIHQSLKLCKMLDITPICWQKSWNFMNLPGYKQMMKDIICIDFKGKNAHDYYVEKYGEEKILCDETHFNDCTNEEMIRDFFTPELTKLKKIIEIKKKTRRK